MKRKAAVEREGEIPLPKKRRLTAWQQYLKEYALTEGLVLELRSYFFDYFLDRWKGCIESVEVKLQQTSQQTLQCTF